DHEIDDKALKTTMRAECLVYYFFSYGLWHFWMYSFLHREDLKRGNKCGQRFISLPPLLF
ncbi:hypothetical protein, partial [Pseudodesulfovibrio pelocollis]|uniref:hypothetical protein n=1 Tax=Pseudodesulfovibrio pelocollis TaxID=3051432 RepID=UPI00255B2F75